MLLYALTIFLSAFLLFQVQPLIAKIILPWFGGSAAVWSAAMLFFQLVLLAGYGYAHWSIRNLKARSQMLVHAGLLLVSCALLPILPNPYWRPTAVGDPTLRILMLLVATIGLPYFLLSSTSPLLQAWYVRRSGSGVPYRLFALSNFGSMLALVSFPFLVEPRLASRQQAYLWSAAYAVFAILCAATAWVSKGSLSGEKPVEPERQNSPEDEPSERPPFRELFLWVMLAACASVLLVSSTNHMSENIAPIPLLWVLPLALYLLTFIFAFEGEHIYKRWFFGPLLLPALGGMAYMIYANDGNFDIKWAVPGFAIGLFLCCMVCHGELSRRKPAPRYLTLFYLMVSLGGAVGGVFVALIAPRVFHSYLELPLGLAACGLLAAISMWNAKMPKLGAWPTRVALLVATAVLCGYLGRQETKLATGLRVRVRNFYGPLEVKDDPSTQDYAERTLMHGTINHGSQLLDPVLRYVTTSYYTKKSGVGRAILAEQARGPVRVAVIGLGAGVLSNYGRKGDYFRIYEINPLVERLAQTEFTFFPHSPADKAILMGDARLTMERQDPQNYDVIAVDAFSSDAIPVHLLTREAVQLYFRHLKPDGILALHISNRYLNLEPVCARDAEAVGKQALVVDDDGEEASYDSASTWVLLTANSDWFTAPSFKGAYSYPAGAKPSFRTWTDDYSNLFQILTFK